MSLEYSSRDRHRTVVMPILIVLVMAALGVFYLIAQPVATQPALRAIPIAEAEQTKGAETTKALDPTKVATSEGAVVPVLHAQ